MIGTFKKKKYTYFIACISLILSLTAVIYLYFINSSLWFLFGLIIPIQFLNLFIGPNEFKRVFAFPHYNDYIYNILFIIFTIITIASSLFGSFIFISNLPLTDKSYLFIPSIIFCFFLVGSIIDLYFGNTK